MDHGESRSFTMMDMEISSRILLCSQEVGYFRGDR